MFSPPCTPTSITTKGSVRSPALTTHLVNSALRFHARSIFPVLSHSGWATDTCKKQLHSELLPSNLSNRIDEVEGNGSRSSDLGAVSQTPAAGSLRWH